MPVFIEDEGITLTLKNGDTVTLKERAVNVADRKAALKRQMVLGSTATYKQKRANEIIEKIQNNGIAESEAATLGDEAGSLVASFDASEINADALSFRFESWDVYASRADMEANRSVEMTKEAILAYCEKPKQARIVADIVEALGEYDKREGKAIVVSQENSGEQSRTAVQTVQ